MKKIINFFFIFFLFLGPTCLAKNVTLNKSAIWSSNYNNISNQFSVIGKDNNILVSVILTPQNSALLQIVFPQAGYNFNDNTVITLFFDNNYILKLSKNVFNQNTSTTQFTYTFNTDELKKFIHELTSKHEVYVELDDRTLPVSLKGTSAAISSVLKYIEDNHLISFPEPFNYVAPNPLSNEPPPPSSSDTPSTKSNDPIKYQQNLSNHKDQGAKNFANKILYIAIWIVGFSLAYRTIIKPFINYQKRKKQIEYTINQINLALTLCKNEIENQSQRLYIKREQLIYYDDYGTAKCEKWAKEINVFIESRIYPLLLANNLEMYYSRLKDDIINMINTAATAKQEISQEIKNQLAQPTDFYHPSMSPVDYEIFCAKELRKVGWEANVTKVSGDQGADVIATKNGVTLILQCKLYTTPVGNSAVQEINTAKSFYHADYTAVVSNASYTTSARQIASSTKTALLHHNELQDYANSLLNQ